MDPKEIIYQLGEEFTDDFQPGSPPIHQTANYLFRDVSSMQSALQKEDQLPFYTRGTNPTTQLLCQKLAALEATEDALVFSSGSAAISAAVLAQVKSGDHVVCTANPYSWTGKLLRDWLTRFEVTVDFMSPDSALPVLIRPQTRLIYLESPNSWTFESYDLTSIGQLAQENGITTILDNSYATPLVQRPAEAQIDLVVHSATKYLGGHSDVIGGVVCGTAQHIRKIFSDTYMLLGGIASPGDSWLLLRSLRTLPQRLESIQRSTRQVIQCLESQAGIAQVYYPKPDAHINLATGLFTIDLATEDASVVEQFCNALKVFKLGPSWGSYHSLAFPAIATVGSMNYHSDQIVTGRIRLSIGLEDPDTMVADLTNALTLLS